MKDHANRTSVPDSSQALTATRSSWLSRANGMPRDCVVNCDALLTVPKNRSTGRITRLAPQKMNEVQLALKFAMQIP
jgi:mRNA interferase MazF